MIIIFFELILAPFWLFGILYFLIFGISAFVVFLSCLITGQAITSETLIGLIVFLFIFLLLSFAISKYSDSILYQTISLIWFCTCVMFGQYYFYLYILPAITSIVHVVVLLVVIFISIIIFINIKGDLSNPEKTIIDLFRGN